MTRVWLVDDSDLERGVARRVLERHHSVIEFSDGASVLEKISAGAQPDVIVLDCNLPDVSGLDVTQHIRERFAQTQLPILILSGSSAASEDVVAGLRAGANDYVTKPFSEIELVARVESLAQAKRQRERADAAEHRLRGLLEHLPDPVIAVDKDNRITFANQPALALFGIAWPTDDMRELAKVVPGLVVPIDVASPVASDDLVIADRVYTPAFGRLQLDERVGEITTITLRDVTDKVRAIDRRDQFLAMLAHELRNPLAPIVSAAELALADPVQSLEGKRPWNVVHRQVERLTRLVDDLLDISRVSRGHISIKAEPVDVWAAFDRSFESCQPVLTERRHELVREGATQSLWVRADRVRFEQMLTNLINNAAKYTDEGGRITIGARADGDKTVISIRDNGIGIAPTMLENVFEMFVQVDDALHRSQGGLGIGLPLVRQLAELQGGTISAKSDGKGHGSTFTLVMPTSEPGVEVAPAPVQKVRTKPLKVMLVDDNVDALELLASAVGAGGHAVTTTTDGFAALAVARQTSPDVVFLDIGLPGLDGFEVATRLRNELHMDKALIIALSGYGGAEYVERARIAGFDRHYVKPISLKVVNEILRGYVRPDG